METIEPNYDWYSTISSQRNLTPRCPYAKVDRCPRYYESLSLLGIAGITTAIQKCEDKRLLKKWKKSEHWPKVREHESSIRNNGEGFHNFCPEVAFDVFGLFASELHRYADEIDSDAAHAKLSKNGASANDPHWQWAHITPLHYSECRLYSLLLSENIKRPDSNSEEIFEAKLGVAGFAVNIKEIFRRIWKWVCSGR